jgi:hypothetical protein
MKQDELMAHLVCLRELKLRNEIAELKSRNLRLTQIEDLAAAARSSAVKSAEATGTIHDLGVLGQLRLQCVRRAAELQKEIKTLRRRVYSAHSLTEAARSARKAIEQKKLRASEKEEEHESDQFFNWRRTHKREH